MTNPPPLPHLLRMAVAGERPSCSPAVLRALCGPIDLDALAVLAAEHRVAPWLAAVLAREPHLASAPRFAPIRRAATAQALRSLGLFGELRHILRELSDRNVPVVVLKGPVIAQEHYPDPALRPYGDLDILVHESDLDTVAGLLVDRNYREKNGHAHSERLHHCHGLFQRIFIQPDTGRIVEVHCDHLQIGLEPVGMDEIWERACPTLVGGDVVRALALEDLFVQLCVHLNRHGFERLIWFKDLDLLVRGGRLNWERVRVLANQQDCTDTVAYTLSLLTRMLRTPLPAPAHDLVRSQGWWSRNVHRLLWPPNDVLGLVPQRQWRLRRVVQFAPETGLLRGGLPSLLLRVRRKDKVAILLRASTRALRS
ncbi:MAG: nucleotidyltransferase family protein [Dehalococcoidia bacterium]|nr:nucleotidyltransferase family protein [Dehalococcoidia bacterium]